MQKIIARVLSRLGLESAIKAKVFDSGELVIASDTPRVVVGDGITMGGRSLSPVFHKVTDLAASKDAIYKGDTIFYKNKLYTSKVSGYLQSSITLADFDVMSSEVDETTLTRDANGIILVKDGGVTSVKINTSALGDGITRTSASAPIKLNLDETQFSFDGGGQVHLDTTWLSGVQFKSEKNVANGYAPLNASSLVPTENLPAASVSEFGATRYSNIADVIALSATRSLTPAVLQDMGIIPHVGGYVEFTGPSIAQTVSGTTDSSAKLSTTAFVQAVAALKLPVTGPAHIIPVVTSDNETNGANFLAAYAAAAALTPGGAPLSETNRACVLLLPGTYDWTATEGAALFVPSDNVDIAGISGNRDDVQMVGAWATGITCNYNASNVTGGDGAFHTGSTLTGVFRNCKGGANSFGGSGGTFSGTATDCVGGVYSFGGQGTFSGAATGCTGGVYSFGSYGIFSGTATGCTGGVSSFGSVGTFSGAATGCTGGEYSFGGDYGTFSGTATNCTGGYGSFGGSSGTFSGTATGCTGGDSSFGGFGTFSGQAINCTGGDISFGGEGSFSGTATGCTGGVESFGGFGTFSGTVTITGCVGGGDAFGSASFSGATSVLFKDCRLTSGAFADPGDADVKIRRCINDDLSEANFN